MHTRLLVAGGLCLFFAGDTLLEVRTVVQRWSRDCRVHRATALLLVAMLAGTAVNLFAMARGSTSLLPVMLGPVLCVAMRVLVHHTARARAAGVGACCASP